MSGLPAAPLEYSHHILAPVPLVDATGRGRQLVEKRHDTLV